MSNIQQVIQKNSQLEQENTQLKQENTQLTQKLNETIQKLRNKESSYDALDAENRRNVAKIGELKHKTERLTQDAKRAVCQKCTMRAN
jgi:predicted nuclease with TOPRIM domain